MLILGLLASIAVPSFFLQRDKARDADAKVSVRTAQNAAETVATDNQGSYDGPGGVTVNRLRDIEETLRDVDLSVLAVDEGRYTVRVLSDTGNTFDITRNDDGTTDHTCASADKAGCPADGTWAD